MVLMCEACVFVAALCLSVCIVVFAVVGVVLVSFFFLFRQDSHVFICSLSVVFVYNSSSL